jgi:hypothetical protein
MCGAPELAPERPSSFSSNVTGMRVLTTWVPGFRTGKAWKLASALSVYGFIGFIALLGVLTTFPALVVVAAGVLLVWLMALNAGGLRTRSPGLGSPKPLVAAGSWIGFVVSIAVLSVQADSLFLSPDTIAQRTEDNRQRRESRVSAEILVEARLSQDPRTDPPAPLVAVISAAPASTSSAKVAPTPDATLALTPAKTPTPTQSSVDLMHFVPAVAGYDRGGGGLVCEAGRTSAGCFYFGESRAGATTAGAFVKVTLLASSAEAIAELPDYMHHVDESPVQIGALTATGAWRPAIGTISDPSFMIGLTYGRLVIVVDVQRANSTRAVTLDWARRFAAAYIAEITTYPPP